MRERKENVEEESYNAQDRARLVINVNITDSRYSPPPLTIISPAFSTYDLLVSRYLYI